MNKLRAFVVEDNRVILDSLVMALEEIANVSVVGSAEDEKSALAWMEARPNSYDVVIVDLFLKSGTGFGVLATLTSFATPPLRVVLTNYATPEVKARCEALGVAATFDKSAEIDEMLMWLSTRRAPVTH